MFKFGQIYLYLILFLTGFIIPSFGAGPAVEEEFYKLGFEFQESNHLFNQGAESASQLLPPALIKTPLFSCRYKGQRIFHVEADDYDLEIVTMPFPSDNRELFAESFRILQTFIDKLYGFLGEPAAEKNLDGFVKSVQGLIRDKTYFTAADGARYGGPPLGEGDYETLGLEPQKEEGVLRTIRLHKKADFTPGFKPQFSIQTNLANFLISYFYLFYSGVKSVQTAPMAAVQVALTGKKLEDERMITDPDHNFIALYLYTCVSPKIVRDREGGGGTLLATMISAHQCDYKMYLPLMSRVSFSSLSVGTRDWRRALGEQWPRETVEQYRMIGDHEFGDFYDPRLTQGLKGKLTPTIEVGGETKLDPDLPLIRAALDEGIVTTHIVKKLDEQAFSTSGGRGSVNEYISRYGQHVFDSIDQPGSEHMRPHFREEEGSCTLSFQSQRIPTDLFSPPFLSQEGNSMGVIDARTLEPRYGNFLFEIRAAHRLGAFIKTQVLKKIGIGNTQDFLQSPPEIGSHAVALMRALDLVYNRRDDNYTKLIKFIGEFQ